jgi:hypothetical protein
MDVSKAAEPFQTKDHVQIFSKFGLIDDHNAQNWASPTLAPAAEKLDGPWDSRFKGAETKWPYDDARSTIVTQGDRLFIHYVDNNSPCALQAGRSR